MKSLLTVVLLALSLSAFAQEQEITGITVITESEGKDIATTGIECASYFTIAAALIDTTSAGYAESTVTLAKDGLLNKAAESLDIAKAFTLNSEQHTLMPALQAESNRLIGLLQDNPKAAGTTLTNRDADCEAFLEEF